MNYKKKEKKQKDLEILEQYIKMRCFYCRRKLKRRVYYFDIFSCCFDCFEDRLTEDFLNFKSDPISVTEINDII